MRNKAQKVKMPKKWKIMSPTHFALLILKGFWFLALIVASSVYCYKNWKSCLNFSSLSGDNIIFIGWLLLLVFPLLPGMKISAFGIDLEMEKNEMQEVIVRAEKAAVEAAFDSASNKSAETMKAELEAESTAIQVTVQEEGRL